MLFQQRASKIGADVETMSFHELNNDQRRELVNSQQRFQALRGAKAAWSAQRGSLTWVVSKGREYLVRSAYDKSGLRKQTSLGPRSSETEQLKSEFETHRAAAEDRLQNMREVMSRQSAINRALALGRVPMIGARVMRSLDAFGLLGSGIRILGTNALYAFEAAAGVHLDSGLAATEDIDLLLDARGRLTFVADDDVTAASLMAILKKTDSSFARTKEVFRAINRDGYIVDLIKPMHQPPWKDVPQKIGIDPDDLSAVPIEGLEWLQNAPPFEAVSIDEKGAPIRIVTPDPRVWAVHKLWLSQRDDRQPVKKKRDRAQAEAVAQLVTRYLPHLPFDAGDMKMLPKQLVAAAAPIFKTED